MCVLKMEDTLDIETFNRHIRTFNHNVEIDNNNTAIFENTTQFLMQYSEETAWLMVAFILIMTLMQLLLNCEMKKMSDRIDELENRLPEKQPLLTTF